MFQNIREEDIDNSSNINSKIKTTKLNLFTNIFTKKYIAIYIISFMTSLVGITGGISPFSISMMAASFANGVPAIGIIIVSLVGNLIGFGIDGAVGYLLTTIVMVISFFIIRPKYNENGKNEQIKMGPNLIIATLAIQFSKCFISGFTIYDVLTSIAFSIIVFVFYKIFVNSIPVLEDLREKRAFTIEEVIGTSLLVTIAISCFGDFQILGISVRNVLSILVVLILGWKNGVLVGTTAGVTIGVTLGVITGTEPIMIAAYAISGMIAGILNKFGKIGVIVGFALGNIILAYVANGDSVELIHFREILIASIGLLLIPKNVNIDIEEMIFNKKFLPTSPERGLNKSKEVAQNLNKVSEAIHEMAKDYKQEDVDYEDDSNISKNQEIFVTELLNNIDPYKENMLYDDIANTNGKIQTEIFKELLKNQQIDKEGLIEAFKKCNSYIVGFDDFEINQYLEKNIQEMIRAINTSYKICKADFIWQKKMNEVSKNSKKQLDTVSKAIKQMAKNVETNINDEEKFLKEKDLILKQLNNAQIAVEEISIRKNDRFFVEIYVQNNQEDLKIKAIENILSKVLKEEIVANIDTTIGKKLSFISADKYTMQLSVENSTKSQSEESGDSILNIRLKDGNYLVALSDGMGSGREAKKSSSQALKMLESLLLSGFDKNTSVELINSSLIANNNETFATLDIAIINLYQGKIEFIKSGASPSYIKNNRKVQLIKSNSLPSGIVQDSKLAVYDRDIVNNDILILCSDGIIDSNIEYKNKELWVKYILEDMETENPKKISNLILTEAVDNCFGRIKDDLSVIVCKIQSK